LTKSLLLALVPSTFAINDWAYLCLGTTHGCILAQHDDSSPFYSTLSECEDHCPMIGRELSYTCSNSGNCEIVDHPPNATNYYPTLQACSHNPKCFAPGSQNISYECHGAFGCVTKNGPPDGKTSFATIDQCEEDCHIIPDGYSFGCAGSRPAGCVLLHHKADEEAHFFKGITECNNWCGYQPGA
jgi:hypothetical protein